MASLSNKNSSADLEPRDVEVPNTRPSNDADDLVGSCSSCGMDQRPYRHGPRYIERIRYYGRRRRRELKIFESLADQTEGKIFDQLGWLESQIIDMKAVLAHLS